MLFCGLVMAGCVGSRRDAVTPSVTIERVEWMMGTTARIRAWGRDTVETRAAIATGFDAFREVDRLMSTWREDTELARLNASPADTWVDVSPATMAVLLAARHVHDLSDGAFDPTVLPLMRLWGFRGGEPAVPEPEALGEAMRLIGMGRVTLDARAMRVKKPADGTEIDLGGIAKGYALDAAANAMRASGAYAGLLDLGGNLSSFGPAAAGRIGVQHPEDETKTIGALMLSEGSVATSGGYERFVEIDGVRYGHIIDPRTGVPVDHFLSVTVRAPDGMTADALATAAFVLGPESGRALLESVPNVAGLLMWKTNGETRSVTVGNLDLDTP